MIRGRRERWICETGLPAHPGPVPRGARRRQVRWGMRGIVASLPPKPRLQEEWQGGVMVAYAQSVVAGDARIVKGGVGVVVVGATQVDGLFSLGVAVEQPRDQAG